MSRQVQFVLIRHGESVWNQKNLFTGWTDVDLSETGVEEAIHGGELLRDGGFHFDVCYTSYLKRAIHTANHVLEQLDEEWIPVIKTWKLNERHYGALQGLNKAETAEKYGEDQVKLWRRSFDVPPPQLDFADPRNPALQATYRDIPSGDLPLTESLENTFGRVIPYFESTVRSQIQAGKRVLIAAHGNSLRALMMHLEHLSKEAIAEINIPTGVPLIYDLDSRLEPVSRHYLGDEKKIQEKMDAVKNQLKKKSSD